MKLSFEISRGNVEKDARPAGSRETSRADDSKQLTTGATLTSGLSATAEPPNPGAVPTSVALPDPGPAKEPVSVAPIRWPFPYAVNMSLNPRGEDRRLTPFDQLRTIADVYDIARIAIECRKDHISQLQWDFAPRDKVARQKPTPAQQANINRLREFFISPDKERDRDTWQRMIVEEILVIDAMSIYKRRTRGGDLYALELIDGTTIKPLIDPRGFRPKPPNIAYRQMIYGRPVKGGDCTIDQLMYRPRTVRTWTPYGLSAIECILLSVNTALNRQLFNLTYYSEGNVPEGLMSVPEGWTTDQIKEFQTYWDSMIAGNFKNRQRLRFVGPKMAESVYQFKKGDFTTEFDEWLLKVTCAAIGVQPQEIGFTADVNKATGDQQQNATTRRSVKPLANFIKGIYDEIIIKDFGMPELEAVYTGGEIEDKLNQARIDDIYVKLGKNSIDEVRARDGEAMIGMGPAFYPVAGPPIFIEDLIQSRDLDPLSSDPWPLDDDSERPRPFGGAGPSEDETPPSESTSEEPAPDEKTEKAIDGALSTFKRWCVKRVKDGRGIDVAKFASEVLPTDLCQQIASGIVERSQSAHGHRFGTLAGVDEVFKAVTRSGGLVRAKQSTQRKFAKVAKGYFRDLSSALAAHMKSGIEKLPNASADADQ